MNIQNPILRGFHPDPSLIRVKGDYYLAVSAFEWCPGVRIYHSRDLAHWEYYTAPLDTCSKMDLRGITALDGIWAPCLSYDGEYFYLVYTITHSAREYPTMDTPNYLIFAKDLKGPWSEPVYLNSSGFDPSLFHDPSGKKYLVNMEWDYRRTKSGNPFAGILLQEYDKEKKKLVGEPVRIFEGTEMGSTEGPHLYWHEGYYYLICAEGGTGWFHAVTAARSKRIQGPYEVCPHNPVLSSWDGSRNPKEAGKELNERGLKFTGLQKAGHASIIETADGLSLISEREENIPGSRIRKEYRFEDLCFLEDFQTLRIPYEETGMTINERPGYLRIYGRESIFSRYEQALLARRQTEWRFRAGTVFEFSPVSYQHSAGLIYRYDEKNQYYACVTYDEERKSTAAVLFEVVKGNMKLLDQITVRGSVFTLELAVNGANAQFYCKINGENVCLGPEVTVTYLSDEWADGFTGSFVGMCVQDLRSRKVYADFQTFWYETL